jgi:pilus assembly protein CpaB
VDELAKAKEEGALMLALRSYADMAGPSGRAAPAPAFHHPVAGPQVQPVAVRIYRGEKVTEVRLP